jgi:carbon storage regulator
VGGRSRMLVLSRKVGEEVVIAGNIRVTVLAVQGGRVRLGILAPKEVVVDRQEVHESRQSSFGVGAAPEVIPTSVW